jgi:aryl-alcohol dehydrogenase-like predicted oxidoreductase
MTLRPEISSPPAVPSASVSRRTFLRASLLSAGTAVTAPALTAAESSPKPAGKPAPAYQQRPDEWRNRQPGMAYRRLGRTGFMISEMVLGGSGPLNTPERAAEHLEAIERGVNYLDTSTRYGRGQSEEGWGTLLRRPGMRERVFVSTKLGEYHVLMERLTKEIFDGLPADKQSALRAQAEAMIEERQVRKPGYLFHYFNGHGNDLPGAYLSYVVRREYGFQRKWKKIFEDEMTQALERSLQRLKTDYVDILHFPHGIRLPEELEDGIHLELATRFKQQGKIRANGFSCHTDQTRMLERAAELGHLDLAMVAYNIANQGSLEPAIQKAARAGMGIIAMKAAAAINPGWEALKPVPEWRIAKLNHTLPGDMPIIEKAYLWALQNPYISAVISEIPFKEAIAQNLKVVGRKVELVRV